MKKLNIFFIAIILMCCIGCSNQISNEKIEDEIQQISNKELFEDYYDEAESIMNTMSLEEKVAQMFLVRYHSDNVLEEIKNEKPGGYILYAVDFSNKTKNEIINEINIDQENSKIKMFMAVDEEGGTVVRVSGYPEFRKSKFKSPQELIKEDGEELLISDSSEKSMLLKSLGLNMNLAPVVDLPTFEDSYMYKRSLGTNKDEATKLAKELILNMKNDNMISSMKHFPGYGDNVDTHTGVAFDDRTYQNFLDADFLPFIAGIQVGAPTIMINHNVVKCIDPNSPASLSKDVHKILREELNFSGLIMTDALSMDAVKKYADDGEAVVQAIIAGNDIILADSLKDDILQVMNAIESNKITEDMINNSVKKILACKLAYGII